MHPRISKWGSMRALVRSNVEQVVENGNLSLIDARSIDWRRRRLQQRGVVSYSRTESRNIYLERNLDCKVAPNSNSILTGAVKSKEEQRRIPCWNFTDSIQFGGWPCKKISLRPDFINERQSYSILNP
jgi:hypothetical protein